MFLTQEQLEARVLRSLGAVAATVSATAMPEQPQQGSPAPGEDGSARALDVDATGAYLCDSCGCHLPAARFRCTECDNYDLCRECHDGGAHGDQRHAMVLECEPAFDARGRILSRSTLRDVLAEAFASYPNRLCLGYRGRSWLTYSTVWDRANRVAAELSQRLEPRARVCLCAHNSVEWVLTDLACIIAGFVLVVVGPATATDLVAASVASARASALVCDRDRASDLTKAIQASGVTLGLVLCISRDGQDAASGSENAMDFGAVVDNSIATLRASEPMAPADVCLVLYTSGSTGAPKGVAFTQEDVHGETVRGTSAHDPYVSAAISSWANSGSHKHLYKTLSSGGRTAIIIGEIRPILGRRMKAANIGGASFLPELLDWMKECWGPRANGSYGCSEVGSIAGDGGWSLIIYSSVSWRLLDCPELNYISTDSPHPRGELCVHSDRAAKRLYYNSEAPVAAFDENGWFHTGDIVEVVGDNRIRIIDRKKHIFKLAQGEFVSPERVEQILHRSALVRQAFVTCANLVKYQQNSVVGNQSVDYAAKQLLHLAQEVPVEMEINLTSPSTFGWSTLVGLLGDAATELIAHDKSLGCAPLSFLKDVMMLSSTAASFGIWKDYVERLRRGVQSRSELLDGLLLFDDDIPSTDAALAVNVALPGYPTMTSGYSAMDV
eukprot:m51a1_g9430 hypothetical protein (668) ;mRNA; f:402611-406503